MYMVYSFSAPPCHYISLSDTDTDDYLDPQLTTLLHEKVVRVKKEINWDEEEKHTRRGSGRSRLFVTTLPIIQTLMMMTQTLNSLPSFMRR